MQGCTLLGPAFMEKGQPGRPSGTSAPEIRASSRKAFSPCGMISLPRIGWRTRSGAKEFFHLAMNIDYRDVGPNASPLSKA
jgi:hypothetical protein